MMNIKHGPSLPGRKWVHALVLGAVVTLGATACVMPKIDTAIPDTGWNTSHEDALSPHTQLALGVMQAMKDDANAVPMDARPALARQWQKLADLIGTKASPDEINNARREVEHALNRELLDKIKAGRPSKADLMSFMMGSGMKIPKGGIGSLNPDHVAAVKAVESLQSGGVAKAEYEVKQVSPDQALSPVESLTLGTVILLDKDRDSFEMSQVFKLALYFRPLRRLYDPNSDLVKIDDPRIETVYMDRIWRVLKPEQVKHIREINATRKDMEDYLAKHGGLHGVDPRKTPTFALLEYAVNDFHEQIAPPNTIAAKDKPEFFIPGSLKALSGKNPGDGQRIFEGVCSACHGMDGQGRFPPITLQSYLALHSDHEHFEIIKAGPPQKPGAPVVMPTFESQLNADQIWAITKYLRSWEKKWQNGSATLRGKAEAVKAGVKFYSAGEVYEMWKSKNKNVLILDLQSDIAFRIMGHIPGALHIPVEEFAGKMNSLPKDKELIVIDMFGSEGFPPARQLLERGYKVSYMDNGMQEWNIQRNYPVTHKYIAPR